MSQIVLVEDENELAVVTKDYFKKQGYFVKIINDGKEALDYLMLHSVKLLIIDIMLPGVDGLTICEAVRKKSNIPIIIISAKTGEDSRIIGIELGADDYIEKPYSIKELFVRAKSLLKRSYELTVNIDKLIDGDLVIDIDSRKVYLKEKLITLSSKEFELLKILVENKGRAMQKERLFNMVWGIDCFSEFSTLTVHINKLREKLEKNPKDPKHIKTVWGVGYLFEGTK